MNNQIRQQYLDAIGIQSWQLKSAVDNDALDSLDNAELEIIEQPQPVVKQEPQQIIQQPPPVVEQEPLQPKIDPEQFAPEPQPAKAESFISESVSNPVSSLVVKQQLEAKSAIAARVETVEIVDKVESDSELDQTIKNCKQCSGRQTRLNALAGQGNSNASVFVISDAPNAEEDRAGHYLTEHSLSLFQSMLHSINSYDDYFFTGIIKCYSLSDFLVKEDEISHCASFLHTQIAQIKPSVFLVLGAAQAQTMLQSKQTFNELRGKVHQITINDKQYPLVVSYHPAYLLRNPIYKREALMDLIMLKNLIK